MLATLTLIFFPGLIRKYIVQLRHQQDSPWKEHGSFKNLSDAEKTILKLLRQNPNSAGRILNRLTGQVVQNYSAKKRKG